MKLKLQQIWDLLTGKRRIPVFRDERPVGCVIEQIADGNGGLRVKIKLNEAGKRLMREIFDENKHPGFIEDVKVK